MSQESEWNILVSKAARALQDPFWAELIRRVKEKDPGRLMYKVRGVSEALGLGGELASSIRNLAKLAELWPVEFKRLTADPHGSASKEISMRPIQLIGEDGLVTDVCHRFMWGDWLCSLELESTQESYKYNLVSTPQDKWTDVADSYTGRLVGFQATIRFHGPHKVHELAEHFRKFNETSPWLKAGKVAINAPIEISHPEKRHCECETSLHNWMLKLGENLRDACVVRPLLEREIWSLFLGFRIFFNNYQDAGGLYWADFRQKVIVACLSHWLKVEVI